MTHILWSLLHLESNFFNHYVVLRLLLEETLHPVGGAMENDYRVGLEDQAS